jgi:DNA-binding beta-propeller fold protein YncE
MRLDLAAGQIYWPDIGSGDIRRANLDGTGQVTLLSGLNNLSGLALDLGNGNLYWAENGAGTIGMANLDGSGKEILVSGLGVNSARGIDLDLAGGKIYWANLSASSIQRANLDGSGLETVLEELGSPYGVTVDPAGGKMYWADWSSNDIWRANLDGSGQEILVKGLALPITITLDLTAGQMYWTDFGAGDIRRANLDGTEQQILVTGLSNPAGIVLAINPPAPLSLTGFSADLISDINPQMRFAQPFNSGTFAWFESGAVDDNGVQHNDGLPAGLTFVSATRSNVTYQIQPANASNVLQLGAGQTGTLTLTTPASYSTLYVLASSGDGTPSSLGSGSIHFVDGTSQAFSYNNFDWCNGPGGLHPEAALPEPNGRANAGSTGTAFIFNQDCDFQLYETVIPIDPSYAGTPIASIDFTGVPDAFFSNILAVSGK